MGSTLLERKEEEGRKKDNHIIFHKYRLIKKLGSGGSSVVYLAQHINLDIFVVIKKVLKSPQVTESVLYEANILKNLKNPNIPLLYDIQEDENYHYLVEEFLEGESLVSYVSNQKKLSQELIIEYGIQLCEILHYLHTFSMGSIIHLDLQPRNIIVSNNRLKIIDFGNAICLSENKKRNYIFGTLGFAAPEQYQGDAIDARTDIYGLGALLYYLVTTKEPIKEGNQILSLEEITYISPHLKNIIQKCLNYNPAQRFSSVLELLKQLKSLRGINETGSTQIKSSLNISIAGTQSRIGVTHISLALANFLNRSGHRALYKEKNQSKAILQLIQGCSKIKEKEGTYYYNSLEIRPNYQGIVQYHNENYPFTINDYGMLTQENAREFKEGQIHFLVGGIKEWEINRIQESQELLYLIGELDNLTYLINFTEEKQFYKFMKRETLKAFRVPYFPNPLEISRNGESFLDSLCRELLIKESKKSWKVRRR